MVMAPVTIYVRYANNICYGALLIMDMLCVFCSYFLLEKYFMN